MNTHKIFGSLAALGLLASAQPLLAQSGENKVEDDNPASFTIDRPLNRRGAYIEQIGQSSEATITQNSSSQYAGIAQDGGENTALISQQGDGEHYARVEQTGDFNEVDLTQDGSAALIAILTQSGTGNIMAISQDGAMETSGVLARQLGDSNEMNVVQSGGNNRADLLQDGSGNLMTATQEGGGNQLAWSQLGDNLSDLQIKQNGNQALQVTQSR